MVLVHAAYIGNGLIYKMDNLIIFVQTIYFFGFVNNFSGSHLSQFYYGWGWSHGTYMYNFFQFAIPGGYYEDSAPIPYKLTVLDTNFIRNAGCTMSILACFLAGWIIICLGCACLAKCCYKKKDICYPRIAKDSLIAGFEFFFYGLFYWAFAFQIYSEDR